MSKNDSKKEIMKGALGKVKLVDAGVKNKYGYGPSPVSISEDMKDKVYYPSINLSTKEAPMLTGTKVGTEVTMLVKGCITHHSLSEHKDKKCEDFCLEIKEIGIVSTDEKSNKDEL